MNTVQRRTSGISILSAMQNYLADGNSVYTQKGFACAMKKNQNENTKKLLAFILISAMQAAFLAKNIAKEILRYDLSSKTERDLFIFDTVTMLFQGMDSKEDTTNEIIC